MFRVPHETLDPAAGRRLLDVGCGTGIVAAHFQRAGYAVTGLDSSRAMLERARTRLGDGAVLIHGDAADFTVAEEFPLALSTYDIPNHIGDLAGIRSYLACMFRYDRFETTITNSIVPLDELSAMLREVGWRDPYLAAPADLTTPLAGDPATVSETLPRVYFVARR